MISRANRRIIQSCALLPLQFKLYRGVAGGKFEEVTNAAGLGERPDGMGAFVDLDGDGWEDIIFISGRVQELKNLSADRHLMIREGSPEPVIISPRKLLPF